MIKERLSRSRAGCSRETERMMSAQIITPTRQHGYRHISAADWQESLAAAMLGRAASMPC
jgi:hypothetical protein